MNKAIERIQNLGFLGAIAEEDLEQLSPPPQLITVEPGETILWEGEPGQHFYLLLRGKLRRFVDNEFGVRTFAGDVLPGEGVGASGLLTERRNMATVRALYRSEVARFSRSAFLQLMVLSWEFAMNTSRQQVDRARSATVPGGRRHIVKTIALVPLDTAIDHGGFVTQLAETLEGMVSVAVVDRSVLKSDRAEDIDAAITALEAFERGHDLVLFEATGAVDEWNRLAVQLADMVLFVTGSTSPASLSDIETELLAPVEPELLPRIDLVILHGRTWQSDCGTRRWLDIRKIDEWHHVRHGNTGDLQRLSRILTDNAVTLVLSGGGVRGFTEVGALKALSEVGIPIDRVAGTSMGAIIGAFLARGGDAETVDQNVIDWLDNLTIGTDVTLPILSFTHGRKNHDLLQRLFGDAQIEDLPISFLCLSTDISANQSIVHDRGALWRAIRASSSVPGLMPPLFDDGKMLVDGGILNNIPADVVAERYAGRIIVIDVSLVKSYSVPLEYNDVVPSGWQILWHKLNPFIPALQVPTISDVLVRTGTLTGTAKRRAARMLADLYILPPISGVGLTDFKKAHRMIDLGYQHTSKQLRSMGSEALRAIFTGISGIGINAEAVDEGQAAPIDRTLFNEIVGVDDDQIFDDLVRDFIATLPDTMRDIEHAVAQAEWPEARQLSHRAKSSATSIAALSLKQLFQAIENDAKAGGSDALAERIDAAWREFKRLERTYT